MGRARDVTAVAVVVAYVCTHNNFVIKLVCAIGLYPEVLAGDVEDDTIVDL